MKRNFLTFSVTFALASLLLGQSSASAIFLLIAPGARAGGTGEAQVAAADDAYASYWNPAALAFLPKSEIVGQRSSWLPNLASDMNYNYLGMRRNVPGVGTFGGHIIYLDLGEQERTDADGVTLGTFSSYMTAITAGFGTYLSPTSSIGINVKIIHQFLTDVTTGSEGGKGVSTDFAFDLAYYRRQFIFRKLDFGVMVSNIGPKISFIDVDQADPAPTNLKAGIKWRIFDSEFNKLSLLYDVNKMLVGAHPPIDKDGNGRIGGYNADGDLSPDGEYGENGKRESSYTDPWYVAIITSWYDDWLYGGDVDKDSDGIINEDTEKGNESEGSFTNEIESLTHNIGVEYWYSSYFAIRAGYIYDKPGKIHNPTFGVGIRYGAYGFDFGYIYGEQGHPLANTMRFSLNMGF
ncbi:PorV/PorQ family protein [Candidatus Neomarinimicrobiota bacterium]